MSCATRAPRRRDAARRLAAAAAANFDVDAGDRADDRNRADERISTSVYTTDVPPATVDQFVRIPLPEDRQVTARYPMVVTSGRNRAGDDAFVAFVTGPVGREILGRWGVLPPVAAEAF